MTIKEAVEKIISGEIELPSPIHEYTLMDPKDIPFTANVRAACEQNACGCYGKLWTCPPAVGDWETLRDHFQTYKYAFVYTTKHDLEDSFDVDGMDEGRKVHAALDRFIREKLNEVGNPFEILGAEGCNRCEKCTYPDAPCRFPETLQVTMEATGMDVVNLSKNVGIHYINGANTVTYFSTVFFNL